MHFEWDPAKAQKNLIKHGVSFDEAATVFGDPLGASVRDPDHSSEEDRYITIGQSDRFRLIIVSQSDRLNRVRIISARPLTRAEKKTYEEEIQV